MHLWAATLGPMDEDDEVAIVEYLGGRSDLQPSSPEGSTLWLTGAFARGEDDTRWIWFEQPKGPDGFHIVQSLAHDIAAHLGRSLELHCVGIQVTANETELVGARFTFSRNGIQAHPPGALPESPVPETPHVEVDRVLWDWCGLNDGPLHNHFGFDYVPPTASPRLNQILWMASYGQLEVQRLSTGQQGVHIALPSGRRTIVLSTAELEELRKHLPG
ncbi:MAG: hypothetical protein AAGE52_04695 [Myxococcota bacterium]